MKKSDKKIENALVQSLTEVCDHALASVAGFCWLTHRVNYDRFPASLRVVCVFESDQALAAAEDAGALAHLREVIRLALADLGIKLQKPKQQIVFDSEEACDRMDAGQWSVRFSRQLV